MKILWTLLLLILVVATVRGSLAQEGVVNKTIYDFSMKTIDGQEKSLAEYKGKVVLIVNTASRCGFTPQYKGLEALYEQYKEKGFVVLGFPANNFMGQEPGSNEEIKKFCELKFKTTFPMFSKIDVTGSNMAPLYAYLTKESGFNGSISWNFNKFLVGKDGKVIARYGSNTDPEDPQLKTAVEKAL